MAKESGRTIILFGKYQGTFKSQEECEAFAKGVQTVLNQLRNFRRLSGLGLACFNLQPRWVSIYCPVLWVGQLLVAMVRRTAAHHRL
jgi:hypothetical protein